MLSSPSCPRCLVSARRQLLDHFYLQAHRTYATRVPSSPTVRRNAHRERDKRTQLKGAKTIPAAAAKFNVAGANPERTRYSLLNANQLQLQQLQNKLPTEIKVGSVECSLKVAQRFLARWYTLQDEIDAATVQELCREIILSYWDWMKTLSKGSEQKLISLFFAEFNISVRVVSQIASIIINTSTLNLRRSGIRLLASAAEAGDPFAILRLFSNAIYFGNINSPQLVSLQKKLKDLAEHDNIPQAIYLVGRIAQLNGKRKEAIEAYRRCLELIKTVLTMSYHNNLSTSKKDFLEYEKAISSSGLMPHPCVQLGRLYTEDGDLEGAFEAYKEGAFGYDDADAYYLLAESQLGQESHSPEERATYLTKAAASANSRAAHLLGLHYAVMTKKLSFEVLDPDSHPPRSEKNASNHNGSEIKQESHSQTRSTLQPLTPTPITGQSKLSERHLLLLGKHWLGIAVAQDHLVSNLALAHVLRELGEKKVASYILERRLVGNVAAIRQCPRAMKAARRLLPEWQREAPSADVVTDPILSDIDDKADVGLISKIRLALML